MIYSPIESLSFSLNVKIKGFVSKSLKVQRGFNKTKCINPKCPFNERNNSQKYKESQVRISKSHHSKLIQAEARGEFDHHDLLNPNLNPDLQNTKFYFSHLYN